MFCHVVLLKALLVSVIDLIFADVDECQSEMMPVCAEDRECFNTVGSFECICLPGFSPPFLQPGECIRKY